MPDYGKVFRHVYGEPIASVEWKKFRGPNDNNGGEGRKKVHVRTVFNFTFTIEIVFRAAGHFSRRLVPRVVRVIVAVYTGGAPLVRRNEQGDRVEG